jgi:hypothetical protein
MEQWRGAWADAPGGPQARQAQAAGRLGSAGGCTALRPLCQRPCGAAATQELALAGRGRGAAVSSTPFR